MTLDEVMRVAWLWAKDGVASADHLQAHIEAYAYAKVAAERELEKVTAERDALRAFAQEVFHGKLSEETYLLFYEHGLLRHDDSTNTYIETPLLTGEKS